MICFPQKLCSLKEGEKINTKKEKKQYNIFDKKTILDKNHHKALEICNLRVNYGGISAVKGINLIIESGELVSLIGANGAGKTTLMKAITRLQQSTGSISYFGQNTENLATDELVKLGLIMVPEGRGIFTRMTVMENLYIGAFLQTNKKNISQNIKLVFELLPRLKERSKHLAGTMSGGEQQMLAIGRALMSQPKVLLLDEPSMGLAPIIVSQIFTLIKDIVTNGVTVLLVEQNAYQALSISDRAYVMDSGLIIKHGLAKDLINDQAIKEAYLGG